MRNIVLNQITLCADGSIGIQLLKQVIDNGEVLFSEPHRTVVDCFGDVTEQVAAVNEHLASMGYPAVPDEGVQRIEALRVVQNMSPVVKARMAEVKAEREQEEAAAAIRAQVEANLAKNISAAAKQ